ncbi:MAG: pyrroloquinoline quinone biosynthesis protein PqqE [Labilithrix sp.]|nr:pyrroloquinoline quinone biosynthesis protein PqqE [Labilithrix sp.]
MTPGFVPRLAKKARLRWDRHAAKWLIVYPERGLELNDAAAMIAKKCDGVRTIAEIAAAIAEDVRGASRDEIEADVVAFVKMLEGRGLLRGDASAPPLRQESEVRAPASSAPRPYTLIAELTYRCPLRCPYCSNPLDYAEHHAELTTDEWKRVFTEAEALGVVQLHLTGGEPLARKDLEALAAHASELGLYTNLVTSGVPLARDRLEALASAGIDHVQVSVQSSRPDRADAVAGYPGHAHKLEVMRWVKELGLPLTMNVVLHRENLDEIDALVALAEEVSADRLELANTQYVSWALANRDALLPTREQIERAAAKAAPHRERLRGSMDVLFVKPDYFGTRPKACMDGWARRFVQVIPDGRVVPCHAATSITTLRFDSVKDRSLAEIWESSEAMNAFRGEGWMPEPCRSCDRRGVDFGGCRCQAFALTGDASATDPACELAPAHPRIVEERERDRAPRRYLHRGARPDAGARR